MTMRPARLLVVDDDPDFVEIQRLLLSSSGFQVLTARSGPEALQRLEREHPDLVLLDVMMPGIDGFETLERIRAFGSTPVIMLTALGMVEDRIQGLVHGADDYVPKPFHHAELVGRIHAILNRRASTPPPSSVGLRLGWIDMDLDRGLVMVHGTPIPLAKKEWHVLHLLASHLGQTVPQSTLVAQAWPEHPASGQTGLKVVISRLRRKLDDAQAPYQLLHTVRGKGYRLAFHPSPQSRQAPPGRLPG